MSRRKSDSQLDAEAKGRVVSPALREERPLLRWRVALASEPPSRVTAQHPPELTEVVDGVRFRVIDPGAGIGVSMSGNFVRYLDGSGGRQFPVHDALMAWDRKCRKDHSRWADHRGRPVCSEIVWAVIRDQTSILWASEQSGVSFARGERLLQMAVKWMADKQGQWWSHTEASAGHDREMCNVCRAEDERAA